MVCTINYRCRRIQKGQVCSSTLSTQDAGLYETGYYKMPQTVDNSHPITSSAIIYSQGAVRGTQPHLNLSGFVWCYWLCKWVWVNGGNDFVVTVIWGSTNFKCLYIQICFIWVNMNERKRCDVSMAPAQKGGNSDSICSTRYHNHRYDTC